MTHQPTPTSGARGRTSVRRALLLASSVLAAGSVLAACSPGEEPSSEQGTTPPVITGDQAPGGLGVGETPAGESGSEGSSSGATASLISPQGTQVGTATFTTEGAEVKVDVKVTSGIPAGFHGMHLHSVGKCESNSVAPTGGAPGAFLSAGSHLQVDGRTGHPASGDLVSMFVSAAGTGETVTTSDAFTISDIVGKSIMIHANADNFANIPTRYAPAPDQETLSTGDAGGRIACGVIEQE